MELEVGMYVRTKYGDMFILDKIEDNCLIPRNVYIPCIIIEEDVKKASHNIIDLIEVGDYVNGHKVQDLDDLGYLDLDNDVIKYDDIKTIVTKEEFESISYKVGD